MKIEIPTQCPCCQYPLTLVNEQLFCRNTACGAQLGKKLEHFCKTLGIKGMGPKTLDKLALADLSELFYLDIDTLATQLGSVKTAEKLLREIDMAKSASLETVLVSFSIPLFGNTAAKKLCAHITDINDITYEVCKKAGLGDKVTENLINWLQTEFVDLKEFLPFSFKVSQNSSVLNTQADAASVCITGKLKSFKTKAEAQKALLAAGYSVVESVTKNTQYLVDEENKSSSKRIKAESLGTPIITDLTSFLLK
jgi:DNA ligase (NAD+)